MKNNDSRIGLLERTYVEEVLSSEFRSSRYKNMTARFESAFKGKYGMDYGISFVNGTATMHAILEAIGLAPGDEVIVPPLTMSSTAFAVLQANGTPIFADVDSSTWQISPESISKVITSRTKAIITVALYGLSPDIDEIRRVIDKRKISIIEDNAECFLGKYKGRLVGTLGDFSSFSFQSSKHLTSGEGGIVLTNNRDMADKIRAIQSLGYAGLGGSEGKISKDKIQHPNYNRHIMLGWNYRMPELCAAVALAQTERMDELVELRKRWGAMYSASIQGNSILQPQAVPSNCEHSYWTWAAALDISVVSWDKFRAKFLEFGGDTFYSAWKLTYLERIFIDRSFLGRERFISDEILDQYGLGLCPIAEQLQPTIIQLKTNYRHMDDMERQCQALSRTVRFFS